MEHTLDAIHAVGKEAGIVLKPETGLGKIPLTVWNKLDVLQIMTVAPGLKGQHFNPLMLEKIAGANIIVVGKGLFVGSLEDNIRKYFTIMNSKGEERHALLNRN